MELSDRSLIDRFLGGNQDAFGIIVSRWERQVLNLAYRLMGDFEEALDIRQSTFIRAYQGLQSFNGASYFSTWLYRIVVNLCRDRIRTRKSHKAALREISTRWESQKDTPPERDPERWETVRIVADAVAALSETEREVVILKHYHGRSFSEIAAIVGAPASTVKSRMLRGLKNLRLRLKDLEE